mmetsp:Transcript_3070/g.7311  ORF Transcript_3070/g.7311 Transcript_3070/m.7311 type:complete len:211 (+) Transcript_3070:964-1596(+)
MVRDIKTCGLAGDLPVQCLAHCPRRAALAASITALEVSRIANAIRLLQRPLKRRNFARGARLTSGRVQLRGEGPLRAPVAALLATIIPSTVSLRTRSASGRLCVVSQSKKAGLAVFARLLTSKRLSLSSCAHRTLLLGIQVREGARGAQCTLTESGHSRVGARKAPLASSLPRLGLRKPQRTWLALPLRGFVRVGAGRARCALRTPSLRK